MMKMYHFKQMPLKRRKKTGDSEKCSAAKKQLEGWLNKNMRIKMTDGRILVGIFVCTDKDKNVILGSCQEFLNPSERSVKEEPRVLGLAMVPGHQIVTIEIDDVQNHGDSHNQSEEDVPV